MNEASKPGTKGAKGAHNDLIPHAEIDDIHGSYLGSPLPIVKFGGWAGESYACYACYQGSLTATATTVTMSTVERRDVPVGASCSMCHQDLGGSKRVS